MFKAIIMFFMVGGLAGCTYNQREALFEYARVSDCATKYSQQHGTGISESYLRGLHECRKPDSDYIYRKK